MNLHPLLLRFLPLALVSIASIVPLVSAATKTNNPLCSFVLDTDFKRTCIASTAYDGERCFYTYIPDCALESLPVTVPLVFDIHGLGSCPLFNVFYTGWKQKADENCFVLVLPTGNTDPEIALATCFAVPGGIPMENDVSTTGCCCTQPDDPSYLEPFEPSITDDLTFLRQTAAVVVREVPIETSNSLSIDTKRIYMAGHSNGCITSLSMAAIHSDLVAAVGCHAGALVTPFAENYVATPVWMAIGTADPEINYNGSDTSFPFFLGAETMHLKFTEANECLDTVENQAAKTNSGLNSYTEFVSSNCNEGANVVLVALDDVGHSPYLGDESSDVPDMGGEPVTLDTTQMAWDFVKSYSLVNAPILDDAPPVLLTTEESNDDDPSSSSCRSMAICVSLILSMITINLCW